MKIIDDDGRGANAPNPIAAVLDIKRRNEENEPGFTAAQKALAEKLRTKVQAAHSCGRTFPPNYRKNIIAVKASGYRTRDRLTPAFDELKLFCEKHNIDARYTAGGAAIYSIK
jgi:hypothetical protein